MYIVVSGATKGIGRAIADEFASRGFHVAACARNQADLAKMRTHYAAAFPDCKLLTFAADLRHKVQAQAFAAEVLRQGGRPDVVVNNAGAFLPGAIHDEPEGRLEEMISVNLYSAYHLTRALLPSMLETGKGHIFNMCSIASLHAYPDGGSYSISKFALLGFSKNLREELKDKGIKVTSIMPGATWSASWAGADFPEDRLMQAADIANAVWSAWSMSPAAVVEDIVIRPQLGDLP
ncbi:MAG: SDR family oxidoreductase [Saprospiraceae bacterium]